MKTAIAPFAGAILPFFALLNACSPPPASRAEGTAAPLRAPEARSSPTTRAAPSAAATPISAIELHQRLSTRLREALDTGDAKAYAALFAENGISTFNGTHESKGRESIERSIAAFARAFDDATIQETRILVLEDAVATEWTLVARNDGELMGIKGTGKAVGVQGASITWFDENGLVRERHSYFSLATVLGQAGITTGPARPIPVASTAEPTVLRADKQPGRSDGVQKLNAAREAHRATDVASIFTEDAAWDDPTLAAPVKGKAAIVRHLTSAFAAVPDAKLTAHKVWTVGNVIVQEETLAGTQSSEPRGPTGAGKNFTAHSLAIFDSNDDGKIVNASTYGDKLEIVAQTAPATLPAAPLRKK